MKALRPDPSRCVLVVATCVFSTLLWLAGAAQASDVTAHGGGRSSASPRAAALTSDSVVAAEVTGVLVPGADLHREFTFETPAGAKVQGLELKISIQGTVTAEVDVAVTSPDARTLRVPLLVKPQARPSGEVKQPQDVPASVGGTTALLHELDLAPILGSWSLSVSTPDDKLSGGRASFSIVAHYEFEPRLPVLQSGAEESRAASHRLPKPVWEFADASYSATDRGVAASASEPQAPSDWQTIRTENFEGVFPSSGWTLTDESNDGLERLWNDDDYKPYGGSWSGWPASGGANGVDPAAYYYPNDMHSWMIYGPFDLSNARDAQTVFYLWREIETSYDYLFFGVSADGTNFSGYQWDGNAGWTRMEVGIGDWIGDSTVWVGWLFHSDADTVDDGPFVDDISITKDVVNCGPFTQAIPDSGEWVEYEAQVTGAPDGALVDGTSVKFAITHAAAGSLDVELVRRDGDRTAVLQRGDAAQVERAGELRQAVTGLDAFNGLPANGTYVLRVRDRLPGDGVSGTIESVSVRAHYAYTGPVLSETTQGPPGQSLTLQRPAGPDSTVNTVDDKPTDLPRWQPDAVTGWETVMLEDFEGAFPSGSWALSDQSSDGCEFLWDDDDNNPGTGAWAAWPANGGANGLDPAGSNYPPNMNSWMIYGPFDLSTATQASLNFSLSTEIEQCDPIDACDYLFIGASSDGTNFNGNVYAGSRAWTSNSLDISAFTGDDSVWIAYAFRSDSSVQYDGPWVDNIQVNRYVPFCGPFTASAARAIPDDGTWIEVPLTDPNAPDSSTVTEASVKYMIDHPDRSQLEIRLARAESGPEVVLWDRGKPGLGAEWGSALRLAGFRGAAGRRSWLLRVRDVVPGAEGRLSAASVRAFYAPVGPLPRVVSGPQGQATALRVPANARPQRGARPAGTDSDAAEPEKVDDWEVIKSETFGSFPGSDWTLLDNTGDGCDFLWGKDDKHYHGLIGYGGWPAAGGGNALDPASSKYPTNMNSWMIYGPFDLSDASDAETLFWMWNEIEVDYDGLFFGVSSDGTNFSGITWSGSSDWTQYQITYGSYTGDSSVWVAWVFQSDDSVQMEGPWLDDIEIRKFQWTGCNFSTTTTADTAPAPIAHPPVEPESYTLLLRSGDLVPEAGIESRVGDRLAASVAGEAEAAGRVHLLVQFQELPGAAQKRELSEHGIQLLRYLPDRAWLVSLPSGALAWLSEHDNTRWIGEWSVERKVESALLRRDYGSWAYDPAQDMLALVVQFPKDVTLARGRELVTDHGGSVRSEVKSINSLVVWIRVPDFAALAAEDEVEWIEQVLPALSPLNDCVRPRIGADALSTSPYDLNGAGIDLLVYDMDTIATTHQAFSGRLTIGDSDPAAAHATHVGGIAAGDGTGSPNGRNLRGMAPGAGVISYGYEGSGTGDIEHDWAEAKNTYGADLGTASIGLEIAADPDVDCSLEGNYDSMAQLLDGIVRGSLGAPYIMTWSAGNERNGAARCGQYLTITPPATGKNPISVGSTDSDTDSISDFSSFGPTDDGRIKPTVAAPGCEASGEQRINSTLPPNTYGGMCGTSMATPAVAGIVTLMLEQYRSTYGTSGEFLPSTAKAILIHTARDRGNVGPDYQYGYGRVDGVSAVDAIINGDFREETFYEGEETHAFTYSFSGSMPQLRVSLAWDDAPASPAASVQLVNDLNLTVTGPDGTVHRPFVLNPSEPGNTATTGTDNRNNQEQVIVANPQAGTWTIRVSAASLPEGPQSYSLVFPGARNAPVAPDSYESDNGSGQATWMAVNTSYPRHNTHVADDVDWMRFDARIGYQYTITTRQLEMKGDTVLELYGQDGATKLLENDDYPGGGTASQITWDAPSSGTYYIRVRPFDSSHTGLHAHYAIDITESILCHTLTTGASPSGGGSVNASPGPNCSGGRYTYGTSVQLTANANTGYNFTSWSGDTSGSANPTSVSMTGNRSVTANFEQLCYTLTTSASPSGGGSVNASPGPNCSGGRYTYGTSVQLTANANTGYNFTSWSGDASGTANPTSVSMTGNKSVTANFEQLCYTLTTSANPSGGGNVNPSPGPNCSGGRYTYGTSVQLTANANTGYNFTSWSGDASGSANPTSVSMTGNRSVASNFSLIKPAAPAVLLSATQLSWSAVSYATAYHVYESTSPYFTPGGSPVVVTGLTYTLPANNANYYYIVRAVNGSVESDNSNRAGRFVLQLVSGG